MNGVRALFLIACLVGVPAAADEPTDIPFVFHFENANSRPTYFSLHGFGAAQQMANGDGIRIGILDHFFGTAFHPELYAGSANFLGEDAEESLTRISEHGYWMAKTLHEVAPGAQIFALNTADRDEAETVGAIVRAVDWAIEHEIDILTYSHRKFSEKARPTIDEAVERAHGAGIVPVFIHYGKPENILPGGLFPGLEDGREPDVFVLHYDYSVLFTEWYAEIQRTGASQRRYVPFLSISSTAVVTAGALAMVLEVAPGLSPEECRDLLRSTAAPLVFEGREVPRALDAAAAVHGAVERARNREEPPPPPFD